MYRGIPRRRPARNNGIEVASRNSFLLQTARSIDLTEHGMAICGLLDTVWGLPFQEYEEASSVSSPPEHRICEAIQRGHVRANKVLCRYI
jgi:hypothetical protein